MDRQLELLVQRAGIRSMEALARQLAEHLPGKLNARSLAVQLGRLNKGATDWWLRRPEAVEVLVEILHCAKEDLLLHESRSSLTVFEFDDFPELRPLDLAREECVWLGRFYELNASDNGFEPERFPLEVAAWLGWSAPRGKFRDPLPGVVWLKFPPGTGADLFWAYLKARTQFEARDVTSISDAAERLKQFQPLCLRLADSRGRHDLKVLAKRNPAIAVVIVAPFDIAAGMPGSPNVFSFSWHTQNPRSALSDDESPDELAEWNDRDLTRFEWRLESGWKTTLLEWVERRLNSHGDTLFDADKMATWLAAFGDRGLVETPRDLLSLCRLAHHSGTRKLPRASDRHAGRALLTLLAVEDNGAKDAFEDLVQEWFFDLECTWIGPISARKWRELTMPSKALLDQIVSEENPDERKRLASGFQRLRAPEDRANLDGSCFLRRNHAAEVCLALGPLAKTLARDALCIQILRDDVQGWGRLCFDSRRLDLIQQSLGQLTVNELEERARFINTILPSDAAVIGAEEAIYCALGFRDLKSSEIPKGLRVLAQRVIRRAANAPSYGPWSVGSSLKLYWENACWAWSLGIDPHESTSGEHSTLMQFSDWRDAGVQQYIWLESPVDWQGVPLGELGVPELRCIELARRIVARFQVTPGGVSGVFLPMIAAHAVRIGWEIKPDWWKVILQVDKPLLREVLAAEIARSSDIAEPLLRSLLVMAADQQEKYDLFGTFLLAYRDSFRVLREAIFTKVDENRFVFNLKSREFALVVKYVESFPPTFSRAILERLGSEETRFESWNRVVRAILPLPFEVVLRWVDDGWDAFHYADYLWRTGPERVLEELPKIADGRLKSILAERFEGSHETLRNLLGIMKLDLSIIPKQSDRAEWAMRYLPGSGSNARDLMTVGNLAQIAG